MNRTPPIPQWSLPLFQSPGPPCRLSGLSPVCDPTRLPYSALVCAARLFLVHRPSRADYRPTPHGSSTRIREKSNTQRHGHDWPRITYGACADHLARDPTLHAHHTHTHTLHYNDLVHLTTTGNGIHCPSAGRPSRQRLSCTTPTVDLSSHRSDQRLMLITGPSPAAPCHACSSLLLLALPLSCFECRLAGR